MTTTTDRRVFLGLNQPPLLTAAHWLVDRAVGSGLGKEGLDLSRQVLVLPTQRSTQRLLQLLIRVAREKGHELMPPLITSVGQLPEFLYVAEKPLATDLAQQLAWSQALQQASPEHLACLTGSKATENLQDWQPLATLISRLHTRLANDIWSFRSVARAVGNAPGFLKSELHRWEALNELQQQYYSILREVDLWDRQAARNYAAAGLAKAGEVRCATDRQVVLIGTADLNRSVSEMVRQIAMTHPHRVDILIAADPEMADRFDDLGCLITEAWVGRSIDVEDRQIRIVDQPGDQADAVAMAIAELPPEFSTDQITIGVPDPNVLPQLQRSLNSIEVPFRSLAGRPLSETPPVRLLLAIREYLQQQAFSTFAELVRHPDMFAWLVEGTERNDWLPDLDEYQNQYLPQGLRWNQELPFGDPKSWSPLADETDAGDARRAARQAAVADLLNRIHARLAGLLKPLVGPPQSIAEWTAPWSRVLIEVYGDRSLDADDDLDRQVLQACEAVFTALGNHQQVPQAFGAQTSSGQALDWAIQAASETRVIPPPMADAVELAGWLDLALDDAPVMIITGMNDEHVPSSETGHQFLPNELCKQLGILDNDRRYARDAYALTVIQAVRERLLLIAGRRNEQGEPGKPSRLLFATDAITAARRAKAYFGYEGAPAARFWITGRAAADFPKTQQFPVPQPVLGPPLTKLSVTKFRDYIKCPYRFYLQHVLKLQSATDDWSEMSGGTFGDLCHQVLEDFGGGDHRDLDQSDRILEFWNDRLDVHVARMFSGSRMPSVRIQVEQLRLRFEQLAPQQARWRQQGWRIVSTEELLEHQWIVEGEPFVIRGKIDRVDQHETTGQVAVWDYKSSDKGESAERAHFATRKKQWKDLQLPLYRHLVREVAAVQGADFSNLLTGYILLPKKLEDVRFDPASWNAEQLASADDLARSIIRQIRGNVYWPPNPQPPMYSEDFAAICQDQVSDAFLIEEPEVAAPW